MNEKLYCPQCNLPNGRKHTKNGSYCKKCHSIRQIAYAKQTGYASIKKRQNAIRQIVIGGKNKPCADCHLSYPWYVMDYDHVRGEKLFNLSVSSRMTVVAVEEEIAKCDVVCANCHRERTFALSSSGKMSGSEPEHGRPIRSEATT